MLARGILVIVYTDRVYETWMLEISMVDARVKSLLKYLWGVYQYVVNKNYNKLAVIDSKVLS